jgi:transaldolase
MNTDVKVDTSVVSLNDLKVKIYADGADLTQILTLIKNPIIKGLTTNPSLMRAAGITDYEKFARELLSQVKDLPISFEVFADELEDMEAQAREIASWGSNVYVKIPITNTKAVSTAGVISRLSHEGIALNITAILTLEQVEIVAEALCKETPAVVSVFAGRMADTGVDPIPLMLASKQILKDRPKAELLWASTRELLNIYHAEQSNSDIVTVPHSLLSKINLIGKNLENYSLETVQMFFKDATASAYTISVPETTNA